MDDSVWGEQAARRYDESSASMFASGVLDPTVDFLTARAGDGAALEFAIGTGRVALPLRARGVPVAGIELSEPMAAQLRAKPGSEDIRLTMGDMARTRAPGDFSLVYLVYNTITNLLTQDEQVECFRNAARHLQPGGRFVIEVFVPYWPQDQGPRPFYVGEHGFGIDTFDVVNQRLVSNHYRIRDGQLSTFHSPHRFVWPAELDLMARIAGMDLRERWADWTQAAFTSDSRSHVSVWQRPENG